MRFALFLGLALLSAESGNCQPDLPRRAEAVAQDFVVIPNSTNPVQFRLYTNAAPDSPHLFNTFDIEGYGAILLQSPGGQTPQSWLASSSNPSLHNVLVDSAGPELAARNSLKLLDAAQGPAWRYISLDASAAYRSRLQRFTRSILFVEPDLFVLYDHLVGRNPVEFEMLLRVPAATRLDTDWGDLHLDTPQARMIIHSPGRKRDLRAWRRLMPETADTLLPGTTVMSLAPTNKLAQLRVITVFGVRPASEKTDYTFKLLESTDAFGAQIQRDGLPTLVAFNTSTNANASLIGFRFSGPAGVYVFRPVQKPN